VAAAAAAAAEAPAAARRRRPEITYGRLRGSRQLRVVVLVNYRLVMEVLLLASSDISAVMGWIGRWRVHCEDT